MITKKLGLENLLPGNPPHGSSPVVTFVVVSLRSSSGIHSVLPPQRVCGWVGVIRENREKGTVSGPIPRYHVGLLPRLYLDVLRASREPEAHA